MCGFLCALMGWLMTPMVFQWKVFYGKRKEHPLSLDLGGKNFLHLCGLFVVFGQFVQFGLVGDFRMCSHFKHIWLQTCLGWQMSEDWVASEDYWVCPPWLIFCWFADWFVWYSSPIFCIIFFLSSWYSSNFRVKPFFFNFFVRTNDLNNILCYWSWCIQVSIGVHTNSCPHWTSHSILKVVNDVPMVFMTQITALGWIFRKLRGCIL